MESKDILIVGAGVAGLTAGIYAARSGMKATVIDEIGGGGQIFQIDNLENYPGIFPAVSGTELTDTLINQAESFGAELVQAKVSSIDKKGAFFSVLTNKGEFSSKSLILCTGSQHTQLEIPGEKEFKGKGVSYCAICDGPFFKGKNVVVVGGGDSACTEALFLSNIAAHVDLIHRRDQLRTTQSIAAKVFSNEKISIHFDSTIKEIRGESKVSSVLLENTRNGNISQLSTDAVFIFVGMKPRTSLLEMLKKDEGGYFITDEKMATAIPGLFIAGDVRSKPLRQIVTAASDGAIAAHSASEFVKDF